MWFEIVLVASILSVAWNVWKLRREASARWEATYGDDDEPPIVRHVGDSQASDPEWTGQEVPDRGEVWGDEDRLGFHVQSPPRTPGSTSPQP